MRVFIFDLDDTLGEKTPPFPAITKVNTDYLRALASQGDLLCIATARPKSLTYQGMKHGGLSREEVDAIFPIAVYEDGLYAESKGEVAYNALENAEPLFKAIWKAFYDTTAQEFFSKRGFLLVPGRDVEHHDHGFIVMDYQGNPQGKLEISEGVIPIYQQDNLVKQVYKAPRGFRGDDMNKLEPIFKELASITREHLASRFPGWENVAELYVWKDAIDLYPKLGNSGIFIKGHGLERALERFNLPKETRVYICGDGKNDIQVVEWVSRRFPNYHVVCPSNTSAELKEFLSQGGYQHTVVEEDCTEFARGLERVVAA